MWVRGEEVLEGRCWYCYEYCCLQRECVRVRVVVSPSRVLGVSGIVTATGAVSSWKLALALALDEFNCSIALTYLADPKASPRVSVC